MNPRARRPIRLRANAQDDYERLAEDAYQEVLSLIPSQVELVSIHGNDGGLDEDQVAILLGGGYLDDEDPNFDQWMSEALWIGMNYHLDEIRQEMDSDIFDLAMEHYEIEIREAFYAADASNAENDLLRQTGGMLFRYRVPGYEAPYGMDDETLDAEVSELLSTLGLSGESNEGVAWDILANSYSGGPLWIVWNGDPQQEVEFVRSSPSTISWTDPYVAIHDPMSGSGYMAVMGGKVTLPFDLDDFGLDGQFGGYSMDDVYGGLYLGGSGR